MAPNAAPEDQRLDRNTLYDRADTTRLMAIAALVATWAVGIVCTIVGTGVATRDSISVASKAYLGSGNVPNGPYHDWPGIGLGSNETKAVVFLFDLVATFLIDSTGLIHSTTLRWALGSDLVFNSNLRLFTSAKHHLCFGPLINAFYTLFIVVSYAAASSLVFALPPSQDFCDLQDSASDEVNQGCGDQAVLATPALCCLGVGMLGQASLATWQMLTVAVPTWSTNPLDNAWASVAIGARTRVPDRCLMSVHEAKLVAGPQQPKTRQLAIWNAHKEARRIMYFVWTLTAFSYVWFGVTLGLIHIKDVWHCNGCNAYTGLNWNLFADSNKIPTSAAIIPEYRASLYPGLFTLICVFQGLLTLALHCVELITTLHRDESTWRQCASKEGPYSSRPNALVRAAKSWVAVSLYLLKALLHWIFGQGMTYAYNWGVFLRPPQLLYLSIGMTVLAGHATFLCFQRPQGAQPAAFGHVQTIVDLVDEWHPTMFWGDKGLGQKTGSEVRHAGTAGLPLVSVMHDALYEGVSKT